MNVHSVPKMKNPLFGFLVSVQMPRSFLRTLSWFVLAICGVATMFVLPLFLTPYLSWTDAIWSSRNANDAICLPIASNAEELPRILDNHLNSSCKICHLPMFCVLPNGTLTMSSSRRDKMLELARRNNCNLELVQDTSTVRFSSKDGSTIQFENISEDMAFQPLDILNMEQNYAFSEKPISETYVNHIPHYYRTVFLNVWRIISVLGDLSNACSLNKGSTRHQYLHYQATPTLLILDNSRISNKHWFVGFHKWLQRAYPSVVVLDLSSGRKRARYEANECYRSGLVSACKDPWWAGFHSETQRSLSQTLPKSKSGNATVVGFLTRKRSRSLLQIDETKSFITEQLEVLNVSVEFVTFEFEGLSFESQVKHVANVDILIAAHGAGLTNLIFMSPGSQVVEIIPFGYNQDFEDLARIADLSYQKIFAYPLVNMVFSCANQFNLSAQERGWLQNFKKAASKVVIPTGNKSMVPYIDFGATASVPAMINCLRDQNLTLQPDIIGLFVVNRLLQIRPKMSAK
jgi:hypothetical protein